MADQPFALKFSAFPWLLRPRAQSTDALGSAHALGIIHRDITGVS